MTNGSWPLFFRINLSLLYKENIDKYQKSKALLLNLATIWKVPNYWGLIDIKKFQLEINSVPVLTGTDRTRNWNFLDPEPKYRTGPEVFLGPGTEL